MNYELRIKKSDNNGYTLIETMISIAIFLIIVVAGMGALLNANLLHNKSKDMRSIIDSLSFTMDDISRNLRTGYNYHCIPSGGGGTFSTPLSGQNCVGIAFTISGGSAVWAYEVTNQGTIQKSTDGGNTWVQMTPSEVTINTSANYYAFSVFGAEPPPADTQQPFVNIHLVGTILYQKVSSPFSLQTSISQREIDI